MPKIPTPRTAKMILVDTFAKGMPPILVGGLKVVSAGHAEELERELTKAKESLRKIREIVS